MTQQLGRILSGMRPTGRFHLGNYLGAVRNWVDLQSSYEAFYCIVDLHALTTVSDASSFNQDIWEMAFDLIAAGIDERSALFVQSQVPEVPELHLLLSMVTPLSWLQRVPTFKEKVREQPDNVNYGLLGYPVLQTADILIYRADRVPVGKDQLAHLELAREIARRFNSLYGASTLPEPEALLTDSPVILGLDGQNKMSKSLNNHIEFYGDAASTRKRVMQMVTDVKRTYLTQPGHPEQCNVCQLHKVFSPNWRELWDGCREAKIGCGEKKAILADNIIAYTEPYRAKRDSLDQRQVAAILESGAERARAVAKATIGEVRQAVGIWRPAP